LFRATISRSVVFVSLIPDEGMTKEQALGSQSGESPSPWVLGEGSRRQAKDTRVGETTQRVG
jgi:hypothetical protein